jgi:hypothetical protein
LGLKISSFALRTVSVRPLSCVVDAPTGEAMLDAPKLIERGGGGGGGLGAVSLKPSI